MGSLQIADKVQEAMAREEAKELGLIPDDTLDDPTEIPDDILEAWDIEASEVGQ